jgi:alkylation response protein AidB-like acyl-CoA dehydrogenase
MLSEFPLPSVREAFPSLDLVAHAAPEFVARINSLQLAAREFGQKFISPKALDIEDRCEKDPHYFPWDVIDQAFEYGFLQMLLPRIIGGGGKTILEGCVLLEELYSFCGGIGTAIGANSLGLCPLAAGGYDMNKYYHFLHDTLHSKWQGHHILWAWALTEPEGGSDLWDSDEIHRVHGITTATRVPDGYLLNGRKCFISNGSVARYISVYAALDNTDPHDSMSAFVVPNDTPGFSVTRIENKMGQRACKAAELTFENVHVPISYRLGSEREGLKQLELTTGISRGAIGASGVGIARGALQRVWSYASRKRVGDHLLIDEQWVQLALADMAAQIQAARQVYFASAILTDLHNPITKLAIGGRVNPGHLIDSIVEATIDTKLVKSLVTRPKLNETVARMFSLKDTPKNQRNQELCSMLASTAKVLGSDLGMSVSTRALEIAGTDGSRRDLGLEKCFRDAKVIQIYEGTNQINTINIFKKINRWGQSISL